MSNEHRIKQFQQQVVKLLQKKETKTEEYNELKVKFEALDKEFAETIIRMSVLKLEIKDLDEQFEHLFSTDYKL